MQHHISVSPKIDMAISCPDVIMMLFVPVRYIHILRCKRICVLSDEEYPLIHSSVVTLSILVLNYTLTAIVGITLDNSTRRKYYLTGSFVGSSPPCILLVIIIVISLERAK